MARLLRVRPRPLRLRLHLLRRLRNGIRYIRLRGTDATMGNTNKLKTAFGRFFYAKKKRALILKFSRKKIRLHKISDGGIYG